MKRTGFSLLEFLIAIALSGFILQAAFYFYQTLETDWKFKQAELKSLENAVFFLEKLSREFHSAAQILNTPDRPTDDFHLSFLDAQNRAVTYYLEETTFKRKLDAVQPLTEDAVILNLKLNPAKALFNIQGNLVKVEFYLANKKPEPLRLVTAIWGKFI